MLETLQRESFRYFLTNVNLGNGLIADNTLNSSYASIAATGFALACYPVAVERSFIDRRSARERTLAALRFFANSEQSENENASGYKGFYYHFLDMKTGRRARQCEVSTIDTALLLAGVLTVGMYFDRAIASEREIVRLAEELYRRVDWRWAQNCGNTVSHGWKPESGFLPYRWEGYNEALVLYILGLGSPTYPLSMESYAAWSKTYQWKKFYGYEFLYCGPLFMHQFSHQWIDFRGIQDMFMTGKGIDYFENSRRAVRVHQGYAIRNPKQFRGYDEYGWGISASDGPNFLYRARSIPWGPDDGTLSPAAVVSSLPFEPELVFRTIESIRNRYPMMVAQYGLSRSFNPSIAWVSAMTYGIEQGPVVTMIENYRTEFLWSLMRQCPCIISGLRQAGFHGGWLAF